MAPRKLPKDALLTEILQKVSSAKTKTEKVKAKKEQAKKVEQLKKAETQAKLTYIIKLIHTYS